MGDVILKDSIDTLYYLILFSSSMSNPSNSAKAKPVVQGILFGNVTLKDLLNGLLLEGSDLDSLMSVDVPDTDSKNTGNVNDSVPEKKVVVSDDDNGDPDVILLFKSLSDDLLLLIIYVLCNSDFTFSLLPFIRHFIPCIIVILSYSIRFNILNLLSV